MTTSRVIVVLLSLTVLLQGFSFYKQYFGNQSRTTAREAPVRDAPKGTTLEVKNLPTKGSGDAKIALVEFSDYECPFCSRYATGAAKEIDKEFVRTGKVVMVFVNNPLPIHPNAKSLATAAICAGQQGQYWEMHDTLFTDTPKNKEEVLALIHKLPLDSVKFQKCTDTSPDPGKQIDEDMQKAKQLQFTGTPSFGIGHVDSKGNVNIEKIVVGAQPIAVFEKAIEDVLASSAARS